MTPNLVIGHKCSASLHVDAKSTDKLHSYIFKEPILRFALSTHNCSNLTSFQYSACLLQTSPSGAKVGVWCLGSREKVHKLLTLEIIHKKIVQLKCRCPPHRRMG